MLLVCVCAPRVVSGLAPTLDVEDVRVGDRADGVGGLARVVATVVRVDVGQKEGTGVLVEGEDGEAGGRVLGDGRAVLEPGQRDGRVAPLHRAHHPHPLALVGGAKAERADHWGFYTAPAAPGRRQGARTHQPGREREKA